jgi:uncharacterized phiE125 gp8 family phage protein
MILYSRVIEVPDGEPVSLDEVKEHLEIQTDTKDAMLYRLISVARQLCEAYTGLSFVTQRRKIVMDRFSCRDIKVPYGPVQNIESITYIDSEGDEVVMADDEYALFNNGDMATLRPLLDGVYSTWPETSKTDNAVVIIYTAGYDDVSGIPLPELVKQAILMQVASMFENRQDEIVGTTGNVVSQVNMNSTMLLDTIKVYWNATY